MTTQAELVRSFLSTDVTVSASELCRLLNSVNAQEMPTIKLSSLSSTLKKMVDAGTIERIENFGPRGGYGYRRKNT